MFKEFFKEIGETGEGKASMARLVYFLSFFPASYHVIVTHLDVMTYITTYTSGYILSKHGGNLITALGNRNNATNQTTDEGGTTSSEEGQGK